MNRIVIRVLGVIVGGVLCASAALSAETPKSAASKGTPASAPGAAQQALRPYLAIYRRGPAWVAGADVFRQPTIMEHIRHHEGLNERLLAAGPLKSSDEQLVGLVLILAESQAAAEQWLAADPSLHRGIMVATIGEWRLSKIRPYARVR